MYDFRCIRRALAGLALASSVALTLNACTSVRSLYTDDGRKGVLVTCQGYLSSWSSCLVKAGRACGSRGYDTIRSDEYDRSLLVACKTADAK